MAAADGGVDWSKLPIDLWSVIGKKIDVAEGRLRFRAVSKSWRSLLPYRQPPWLLLSESHSQHELILPKPLPPPPPRGLVIVGEQHIYQFDLPQSAHQARFVGSTGNWLILIDLEQMIRLLNPFSGVTVDLPSQSTFKYGLFVGDDDADDYTPEDYRDYLVRKVILSPSLSGNGRDCIAMAIHHHLGKLVFARPGDASWTNFMDTSFVVVDVIFYKDQFYALTHNGGLLACDLGDDGLHSPQVLLISSGFLGKYAKLDQILYLVEWLGELLVVIKFVENIEYGETYKTYKFEIYKLDFESKKWFVLKNLGEHSLFLGVNTSVSVLASDYSGLVKKNCIYFTDDFVHGYRGTGTPGGRDMGVFHLNDNSIQPHYRGISTSLFSPPIWIVPTSIKCWNPIKSSLTGGSVLFILKGTD